MSNQIVNDFEIVASGIYLEGLAVDYSQGCVWFSDVIGGGVHSLRPDSSMAVFNEAKMWIGGLMVNYDGLILSSGAGGIQWTNPETGDSGWLIDSVNGVSLPGVNEMSPDGEGGIIFGTCDIENIEKGEQPRPSKLYRLKADGALVDLNTEIGFANGLMYDAERKRLYCNDTFSCVWAFDVSDDFTLSNRRVLLDKDDSDGMALDDQGNVWITGFRSSSLTRISPEGNLLAPIDTPAGAITQIRFGGPDMKDLYINAVPADGGDNLKDGEIPTDKNSHMYKGRSFVAGKKIPCSNFNLS